VLIATEPRPLTATTIDLTEHAMLPLEPDRREPDRLVAVTCLVRGSLSPRARAARNARTA
jgi:hypothetical protein